MTVDQMNNLVMKDVAHISTQINLDLVRLYYAISTWTVHKLKPILQRVSRDLEIQSRMHVSQLLMYMQPLLDKDDDSLEKIVCQLN